MNDYRGIRLNELDLLGWNSQFVLLNIARYNDKLLDGIIFIQVEGFDDLEININDYFLVRYIFCLIILRMIGTSYEVILETGFELKNQSNAWISRDLSCMLQTYFRMLFLSFKWRRVLIGSCSFKPVFQNILSSSII